MSHNFVFNSAVHLNRQGPLSFTIQVMNIQRPLDTADK